MIADLDFLYEAGSPAAAADATATAAESEVVGIADSIAQDGLFTFQLSSGYYTSP